MEFVYLMINGDEWENVVIFLDQNEAIQASIIHCNVRVEIFRKNRDTGIGYTPIYKYYKNGKYYELQDD